SEGFIAWRGYVAANPDLACGKLLARACPHLSAGEASAYDAPFPDARYKTGVRRFPPIVPERLDDPGAALSRKARDWLKTSWRGGAKRKRGGRGCWSGNYARAGGRGGRRRGRRGVIVMPESAPRGKREGTRGYGAEVGTYRRDGARERVAERVAAERGMVTI